MKTYSITDSVRPLHPSLDLGDQVKLAKQTQPVVASTRSGVKMLNIDADTLAPGDLKFIKALGLTISNPHTSEAVAINEEPHALGTLGAAISHFFHPTADEIQDKEDDEEDAEDESSDDESESSEKSDDDDDDSSFFSAGTGAFLGGLSSGGFSGGFGHSSGGGFGGFGGGGFSGGGASASF